MSTDPLPRSPLTTGVPRLDKQRGAVLPFVAVSMIATMGLMVLVIDGGALQRNKRLAQAAADAGALAAANEIFRGRTTAEVDTAALTETRRNGFKDGSDNVTVTVTYPTTSVNSPGSNYVKVVIRQTTPSTFAGLFGIATGSVRAQAVAGLGAANDCLVALEPSAANAISVTASAKLTANKCGIAVNSSSNQALQTGNGGTLVSANSVAVTGAEANPGNISAGTSYQSGVPPAPDPLAYLQNQQPAVGACNAGSAGANYGAYQNFAGGNLSPGVYCGGIGVDNNKVATLSPGLYIIAGGGLNLKHATFTGTGVTFFITNGPGNNAAQFAPVDMAVNANVTLSACTTFDVVLCPLPGVLFYQDPAAGVAGQTYTNFIGSSTGVAFNGTMYFPTQGISTKSNSPVIINGGLVVKTFAISTGQENFVLNGLSGGAGNFALKKATIVE